MTTSKMMSLILVGAIILPLLSSQVLAKPDPNHNVKPCFCNEGGPSIDHKKGPKEKRHELMKLAPEQREKVKAIHQEFAPKIDPIKDQLFIKKEELKALQNSQNPDVTAVKNCATEITNLKKQLRTLHKQRDEKIDAEIGIVMHTPK